MKKFIALFLVFSLLALSGNMFAQGRKGADLIIQRTNGTQVRGELIAVKQNSLLLLERDSGTDVTVDIGDIEVITIVKKSEALLVGFTGLVLGGFIGYMVGRGYGSKSGFMFSKEEAGGLGAAIGGVSSALIGALIGAVVGKDETIQIEGKSDSEIQEILEKLRKKARVTNFQ